jgi:molecular chaperone DnaJ
MRLTEAYSILEIHEGTSANDAKKKYRELSKKYHPDVNKDPGAEDKFKKINEAYARIQKGGSDEIEPHFGGHSPFSGFDPFNPFGESNKPRQVSNVIVDTTISFAESILGTKKEISFTRQNKCNDCNGQGQMPVNNGCDKCNGRGRITMQQGHMIFVQTCNKCMGRVKTKSCEKCDANGFISTDVTISVNIPGGVVNSNILRLAGMGNFAGQFMSMDQFSDAHLIINVTEDPNLKLENNNVILNLSISLLEALRGCKKTVTTVLGNRDINISPMSKNKDEITINRVGVNGIGDQKVILDVEYPKDVSKFIDALVQIEGV